MKEIEDKIMLDKLKRMSEKIQNQIIELNNSFDMVRPIANRMGYYINHRTGELKKLK